MAKVYVNWERQEILGERDRVDWIIKRKSELNTEADFAEWLDDNYGAYEVWRASEDERALIREAYSKFLDSEVNAEFSRRWNTVEVNM